MRLIVECFVWHHVEWSGIGNCNIVTLFNMHDAGSCFFLSLLRWGEVVFLFCSFFGRSGSCSGRSAEMSGSSSEWLARFLHVVIRTRSGSLAQDSAIYLVSGPLSSEPSCKKGRSPELAPARGARFLFGGGIICPCHIPSSEETSGPL